jgi:hypothetical protein
MKQKSTDRITEYFEEASTQPKTSKKESTHPK